MIKKIYNPEIYKLYFSRSKKTYSLSNFEMQKKIKYCSENNLIDTSPEEIWLKMRKSFFNRSKHSCFIVYSLRR